ncbi:MAG: HAMP domain-containing histidine kinase [Acidimicrobiia bacterium]|nr:HAMP domain-containing histidine kinase [Acidimicrobiia bacterium]
MAVEPRSIDQAPHVVMPWLVRLRWASVVALAAAAWAAHAFWQIQLPILPLSGLLVAMAATNAALSVQLSSPAPRRVVIGGALVIDAGLLTGILYLVGGPLNPFGIVYLVGITVAAISLGMRWAIGLAVLSNLAYAFTFFNHRPLEFIEGAPSGTVMTLHLSGMWVAFAAAAALIAYFVGRVSEALADRERELTEARALAAKRERLTALLALGAGAAHELATPLSTIRTAAGEVERMMARQPAATPDRTAEYITVIREEVDRCTSVLDQLSGRASPTAAGESRVVLSQLADELRYRLGESLSRRLDIELPHAVPAVDVPAEPLRQALIALLRNAFDASSPNQRVTMKVEHDRGFRVEIVDHGCGMDEAQAAKAGEPFFTTKPAGAGLGLGLFLVRAFADQMGGSLQLRSTPGAGTTATLALPART